MIFLKLERFKRENYGQNYTKLYIEYHDTHVSTNVLNITHYSSPIPYECTIKHPSKQVKGQITTESPNLGKD